MLEKNIIDVTKNVKALVWDVDGTLMDTYPSILETYKLIMNHHGIDNPNMQQIHHLLIKYSSVEAIEYIDNNYHITKEEFLKEYKVLSTSPEVVNKTEFLNDSDKLCMWAKDNGYRNFIITNKDKTTLDILQNLGAEDLFEEVYYIGKDGIYDRKPKTTFYNILMEKYNLAPDQILYIGDRDLDVITAQKVNWKTVLFRPTDGYTSKPDFTINNFAKLQEVLESNILLV